MANDKKRKLITHSNPKSSIAEAYRTLRTNIHFSGMDQHFQTLMVTSAGPGEGKSTTLANLGVAMAQAGNKVLIVDCDLRKPVQHQIFEISNSKGLTNVMVEKVPIMDTISASAVENLSVLTSGPIPPNPSELLGSGRMKEVIKELKENFDTVLFDAPPTVAVTDSAVLSAQLDGVIVVMRSGMAKIDMVKHAIEQILKAKGKIIGTVLNGAKVSNDDYHYYHYGDQKGRRRHA